MTTAVPVLAGLAAASVLLAAWLTGVFRAYALRSELIDAVNDRSAHAVATPRGGGAAIVVTATIGFALAWLSLDVPPDVAIGLIGGGAVVAAIGWLDDHGHVAARYRLAAHFAGAIWAVWWIGPLPLGVLPFWQPGWWLAADILTVLAAVWFINLYNFMDGIDGLAASEAIGINLGGALLAMTLGGGIALVAPPLLLAAACLGFLWWNWPPARIFMGDACSGYLGFCVAALAMVAARHSGPLAVAWLVLAGVFLADASVTLLRRLLRGEPVYMAHRSHAYQRLVRRIGRHLPVTVWAIAITWLWLFPICYGIVTGYVGPLSGALIALGPLALAAWGAGAGLRDERNKPG